jgi:hypothetical protein
VDAVPGRVARGEPLPGESERHLAPDLPGAATCAALSPAWTKPQVSLLGQVDSRTAPPGESASSAHMVVFAAAPNWLFHAR